MYIHITLVSVVAGGYYFPNTITIRATLHQKCGIICEMLDLLTGMGRYKSWTLDSGLDYELNYGLHFGLDFGLNSRTNLMFHNLPGLPT